MFHRADGPFSWANARLVKSSEDFVVLARYQDEGPRGWVDSPLEEWLGLTLNREKTTAVPRGRSQSLDFLGFTFRYDRDLKGGN